MSYVDFVRLELFPEPWSRMRGVTAEEFAGFGRRNLEAMKDVLEGRMILIEKILDILPKGDVFKAIGELKEKEKIYKELDMAGSSCDGCPYRRDNSRIILSPIRSASGCYLISGGLYNSKQKALYKYCDPSDNTGCPLVMGEEDFLDKCAKYVVDERAALWDEERKIKRSLAEVNYAIRQAEEKPLFPFLRAKDHFNIGDEVFCYVAKNREGAIKTEVFMTGEVWDFVTEGGMLPLVVVKLDEEIYASGYPNRDCRIYCDLNSLEIMLKKEMKHFEKHPESFGVWAEINQQLDERNLSVAEEITKAFLQTKTPF